MGKLFFITLFIFYIYPINSQTQKCESELNGVIIDFQNTNALVEAQILVLDKNHVLQTVISSNVDNFKIKSIYDSNYELEVPHIKYKSMKQLIFAGSTYAIKTHIQHNFNDLREVTNVGQPKNTITNSLQEATISKNK